ncbi:unnamed protein product [Mesocestoides corti]|uniref:R3H domain-containing protein n=1 Tax=Mesocestoides corti TaxID=53468 RepID=A0A158QS44_MESCO|nr:unnamed protein product [Mesocestoides corti]
MATTTEPRRSKRPPIQLYVPPNLRDRISTQKPKSSHCGNEISENASGVLPTEPLTQLTLSESSVQNVDLQISVENPEDIQVPVGPSHSPPQCDNKLSENDSTDPLTESPKQPVSSESGVDDFGLLISCEKPKPDTGIPENTSSYPFTVSSKQLTINESSVEDFDPPISAEKAEEAIKVPIGASNNPPQCDNGTFRDAPTDPFVESKQLTISESNVEDFGLLVSGEKPQEVVKVPVGASNKPPQFGHEVTENASYDPFTETFKGLTIKESSFEDFGLLVSAEKPKEVVKVPVGASSSSHQEPDLDYDKLGHIIELYGFSPSIETMFLESELRDFDEGGYVLKWVDDSHCLAVFSSSSTAERALQRITGIVVKARPVEEASVASKWKIAKSPGDWALPYKKRPPCDSTVANRLISSHLGLPAPKPSPSALQARKEALERKLQKKRNQRAMWGDD